MKKENSIIFTDGSSRGNPGPGGWGAVLLENDNVLELGGSESKTTNNRMEMVAIIEALFRSENKIIDIYTDSSYVLNGITKWIRGWKKNNWKTSTNTEVLNKDLWQKLDECVVEKDINWHLLKGHVGIAGNERADEIATQFADNGKSRLFNGTVKDYKINLLDFEKNKLLSESKNRSKIKAFSYLSLVDGVLQKHTTWEECKNRVEGQKGTKFRKSISAEDEMEIIKSWGF